MEVKVENLQTKRRLNRTWIQATCQKILRIENVSSAQLNLIFVSRQRMQAFNKTYLGRSYATDVLAFNLSDDDDELIGDIIISTDAVIQNAKEFATNEADEIVLYIIHGILHLLGYDDHKPKDKQQMRAAEQRILKKLQPTRAVFC